jgi:SAM-dependent methyltransferase
MLRRIVDLVAAHPAVYDRVQAAAGATSLRAWVAGELGTPIGSPVLDLGGGTGFVRSVLSPGGTYVCLDNDPLKLTGVRRNWPGSLALLADARANGLRSRSVDTVFCFNMSHHVDDEGFDSLLVEAARVCRARIVFLDAVFDPSLWRSRILWRLDRGRHPRRPEVIRAALERHFLHERSATVAILHRYLLWSGTPRYDRGA